VSKIHVRLSSIVLVTLALLVASAIPAMAVIEAEEAFLNTWKRTDRPVADGATERSWIWGPAPATTVMSESYREHPTDERPVQYWDKSRMEINDPNADSTDLWYVTNGLLVKELMTGRMQFGDTHFEQYEPSDVHIAGDPDSGAPSYAVFGNLMDVRSFDPGSANSSVPITQTVNEHGDIGDEEALSVYEVTIGHYATETDHAVASVFWDFMNASGPISQDTPAGSEIVNDRLFEDPLYAVGLPLTEPYWVYVDVDSQPQWVLVQAFERRVLTYTPGNEGEWQVEAGNVGQHYYMWRYGEMPDYLE
jgi:hypothetical protein